MSLTTVDSGLISSGAITLTTQVTGTLPVANGGTGVTTSTGSGANVLGTSPTIASPSISSAVMTTMASSVLTSGTAQASTSGTSIDFTSIPSWVKRITVMFNGVSTNGSSNFQVQIGSGSISTTGYACGLSLIDASSVSSTFITTGFGINQVSSGTSFTFSGNLVINLISANTWIASGCFNYGSGTMVTGGNSPAIGGTLDRVRITTVNGTDAFDAGSINLMYE